MTLTPQLAHLHQQREELNKQIAKLEEDEKHPVVRWMSESTYRNLSHKLTDFKLEPTVIIQITIQRDDLAAVDEILTPRRGPCRGECWACQPQTAYMKPRP